LKVLDLFSGIGGFSLGLEAAGFETIAFCEIDPYCQSVLHQHWPHVPVFGDVKELSGRNLYADVICGGFPCQDISVAGRNAGLAGARSGLWSEYRRLIEEIRPSWAIIENVSILRGRGLDKVLGELTAIGYDAEWHCIPASALGAHHERDRIWIIAYPRGEHLREQPGRRSRQSGQSEALASVDGEEGPMANSDSQPAQRLAISWDQFRTWDAEPDVGRVVHGLPYGMVADELKALGNAVVPQIPYIIGRAIMTAQQRVSEHE
jgi:DNA (cytosine-5)-methyltransferase 1